MGRRFRPRRGTVRPNLPFGACGLSVGEEQPSFPRAGGCGPGPHSLVWGVRVGRPRLLGRTALGRALASGRQSGLPTIRLAKAGYYWFEPFRAARAWRRRGLGVSRHGLSLFRGAARYTLHNVPIFNSNSFCGIILLTVAHTPNVTTARLVSTGWSSCYTVITPRDSDRCHVDEISWKCRAQISSTRGDPFPNSDTQNPTVFIRMLHERTAQTRHAASTPDHGTEGWPTY